MRKARVIKLRWGFRFLVTYECSKSRVTSAWSTAIRHSVASVAWVSTVAYSPRQTTMTRYKYIYEVSCNPSVWLCFLTAIVRDSTDLRDVNRWSSNCLLQTLLTRIFWISITKSQNFVTLDFCLILSRRITYFILYYLFSNTIGTSTKNRSCKSLPQYYTRDLQISSHECYIPIVCKRNTARSPLYVHPWRHASTTKDHHRIVKRLPMARSLDR